MEIAMASTVRIFISNYDNGMDFVRRGRAAQHRIALLPGAWNPPTHAHLELARAALQREPAPEELVFILSRAMPHKQASGASEAQRVEWMLALAEQDPRFSVALSDGGLFIEMAREARRTSAAEEVAIVCGDDAAQRAIEWSYAAPDSIEQQLAEYELWVAPRGRIYEPPPPLRSRVHALGMPPDWHMVSSSEVRRRYARGLEWRSLVPPTLADSVDQALSET